MGRDVGDERQEYLPKISQKEMRFLRLKGLFWILRNDSKFRLFRAFMKKPFQYLWALLSSFFMKNPYRQEDDFFFFGVRDEEECRKVLRDEKTKVLVALSYCMKMHECPCFRFDHGCVVQENHPVCSDCSIGKIRRALLGKDVHFFVVTTSLSIGEKILDLQKTFPDKELFFLITACELSLRMFQDLGNMMNMKGIGIRLSGRVCTSKKAFELAEGGTKPGMTHLSNISGDRLNSFLQSLQEKNSPCEQGK